MARGNMLDGKDLADLGRICLTIRKGDARAALAGPIVKAAVDGLQNFLERIHRFLETDRQDHSCSPSITLP